VRYTEKGTRIATRMRCDPVNVHKQQPSCETFTSCKK